MNKEYPKKGQEAQGLIRLRRASEGSLSEDLIERIRNAAMELQQCRSKGEVYRICTEAGISILNEACSSIFVNDNGKMKQAVSLGRELHNCDIDCTPGIDLTELSPSSESPSYFTSGDRQEYLCPAGTAGACFRLGEDAVFQIILTRSQVLENMETMVMELLVEFARQGLKRISLKHQLVHQSFHDQLTGIHNRNYFNRIIEFEELRAKRMGSSIGFIMVDVDNFKRVNEKYDYQSGDHVLVEVASILENSMRTTDTVLRYGGDEFLLILTGMTMNHCHRVEARINKAVEKSNVLHMQGGERVTVSMGQALWTPDARETIDETLARADSIMCEKKNLKKR
ncbi:MAG: GGDEF domain-containing protein [Candidatus Sabulitectum sp.]|nr:GGDEF domain-containing protein [Candidatus Sabulitectum sp.]